MIEGPANDHLALHVSDVGRAKQFYTEILGMTVYRENDRQVFLHAGEQGVALFKKQGDTPLTTGNDLNHLALNVVMGTYEALKADLEKHGVAVSGRPGEDRCIYFQDPDGHRVKDMDDEGTDTQFLIPTSWVSVVGLPDVGLEVELIRAYHRHSADFCGQFPGRLTTMIVASTRAVDEAVREIRKWGTSRWAVAVLPVLDKDTPIDHPALEPIWRAAQEHDLAVVHHSNTWNPPYFPGYENLWDNIFLGRLASHPWGGMRFMAAFIGSGILDRYPSLRMGVLECGFGWLPFWAKRMDEQAVYVGGIAPLKHAPSEYLTSGRFFCTIERHEGEDIFNHVTSVLGDDVLMWASDYPHSECQFPNSVDNILTWKSLEPDTRRKLLWDNAARFYKRT